MKRHYLLLLTASAALAGTAFGAGQAPAPAAGDIENGKRLFTKQNCYYCHGTEGQGGRDGARIAQIGLNAQGLIRYVRKPAGSMPAFSEKMISDQDLTDIYSYLKSLPKAKAAKEIPLLDQIK